jgi:hypothetical protein
MSPNGRETFVSASEMREWMQSLGDQLVRSARFKMCENPFDAVMMSPDNDMDVIGKD